MLSQYEQKFKIIYLIMTIFDELVGHIESFLDSFL